jgi:hypothetical protein
MILAGGGVGRMKKRMILAVAVMSSFVGPREIQAADPMEIGQAETCCAVASGTARTNYEPVVRRRRRYVARRRYVSRPRYIVKRRSKAKSAAIIGGSAAAGAGIGALAGGGKGAGIGAIAGGAAGLIYDRKTHKKVVRQY